MKFKFDFVCSAYHRGKVVVVYEPNISQSTMISAALVLNQNYIQIVDIASTQCVEFCVEWAMPRAWARGCFASQVLYNSGPDYIVSLVGETHCNGVITVYPFTDLTSPNGADVPINVYVSTDDLEVNVVDVIATPNQRFFTESSEMNDLPVKCLPINESTATTDDIALYHFGEQPISFRTLLKRYSTTNEFLIPAPPAGNETLYVDFRNYPLPEPRFNGVPSGFRSTLSYLRYAYLGIRGSIRKRVHIFSNFDKVGFSKLSKVTANLFAEEANDFGDTSSWNSAAAYSFVRGSVSFVPHTQGGLEFEVPFYSPNLFAFSFADDLVGINALDDMIESWIRRTRVKLEVDSGLVSTSSFVVDTATGEDFTLLRFCGAPAYVVAVPV